jgi:hypothetical protein
MAKQWDEAVLQHYIDKGKFSGSDEEVMLPYSAASRQSEFSPAFQRRVVISTHLSRRVSDD